MLRIHSKRTDHHISTLVKSIIYRQLSQSKPINMDANEFRKAAHAAIEESKFFQSIGFGSFLWQNVILRYRL